MVEINQYNIENLKYTDIFLTRGDATEIILPMLSRSSSGVISEYIPSAGDVFQVTVTDKPDTGNGSSPTTVFSGTAYCSGNDLVWEISSADSTIPCKDYFWNAQITTDDGTYTFFKGKLIIMPK